MIRTIKKILNFFRTKLSTEELNYESLIPEKFSEELKLPLVRIIENFDFSKPSIVIIDDSELYLSLVEEYLEACNINHTNHNILKFYGLDAPFILKDTLEILKEKGLKKIESAIIDIVLPGKIKTNNKYLKMDGIDVSIYLNREFNTSGFFFLSGNILNIYVEYIKEKADKFSSYFQGTNETLDSLIVSKNCSDENILLKIKEITKSNYEK
jgi:CheY-like chemotaxis protein